MISFLKNTLIVLWLCIAFFLGTILSLLRWRNPNNMYATQKLFAWGALPIAGITVELEGAEHLEAHQPCIYISNHQSGLDVATFGSKYPHRTVGIGKKELLFIPFFGVFFAAAGNILIDRKNSQSAVKSLGQAAEHIKTRGVCVGVFPEGTRNRTGKGFLPFKKGAFFLAKDAGVPIVPYVSSPIGAVFDQKTKHLKGGKVILRLLPPIHVGGKSKSELDRIVIQTREQMLDAYYELAAKVGYDDRRPSAAPTS